MCSCFEGLLSSRPRTSVWLSHMPRAKNAKIWNQDLVRACEARRADANARGSRTEHQWFAAKRLIEETQKEIYITSSDSVINLPDRLSKTVTNYLHQVIRGRVSIDAATPREGAPASHGGASTSHGGVPASGGRGSGASSGGGHPLLRTMHSRGGSYAILMCFHDHGVDQILTKAQICRHAQQYCDDPMELNFFAAGGRAGMKKQGWTSIQCRRLWRRRLTRTVR